MALYPFEVANGELAMAVYENVSDVCELITRAGDAGA